MKITFGFYFFNQAPRLLSRFLLNGELYLRCTFKSLAQASGLARA